MTPEQKNEGQNLFDRIRGGQKMESLKKRFSNEIAFCEKNRKWKFLTYFLSHFIQIISIAGAFYGVYWICDFVTGAPIISTILSLVLLVAMIWTQRDSSDRFWDEYWSTSATNYKWLALSILIGALAFVGSGFGVYQGVKENARAAGIIQNDTTLMAFQSMTDSLNSNILASKKTTWKGKITRKSQSAIKEYSKTQGALIGAIIDRSKIVETANNTIKQQHAEKVNLSAIIMVVFYLFLGFIFEACMCFCSKYDYIEYLEGLPQGKQVSSIRNRFGETGMKQFFPNLQPTSENTIYETEKRTIVKGFVIPVSKQPEKTVSKLFQTVPQEVTPETVFPETVMKQPETPVSKPPVSDDLKQFETPVSKQVEKTVILVDNNQELDKWKKYAKTYFTRSQESAKQETREANWKKYTEYKELLESSGLFELIETKKGDRLRLEIKKTQAQT